MPVDIVDNFRLGTDLPLDNRYVANSYDDVSMYWYAGMQVFQTSDSQLYWYDGTNWIPVVDTSIGGNYATYEYVDGSLASRDASIDKLFGITENLDSSILTLDLLTQLHEVSLGNLTQWNTIQDISIANLDASLDLFVLKSGDTMTGDLVIETDLSVNGKGTFGQFNISGTSFPGTPSAGDKFYRTDLELDFAWDSSRGKWLSVQRNTFSAGENRINSGATQYFQVGEAVMDSITGFHMFDNGVITRISIQNNRNVTSARSVDVRVNNSTTYKETITITSGFGARKMSNLDVSAGDIIQVVSVPGGDRIDDVIVNFEIAYRE